MADNDPVEPKTNIIDSEFGTIRKPTASISAGVNAAIAKNVPKGISTMTMDSESLPDYFHVLIYGETNSGRTTAAAMFGGPERTLIISTRAPEQVRIPLRGLGFHNPIFADDSQALLWAIQCPEKAADVAGFPEWKDRADRVLVIDDMTEGMALLVDDNSFRDDGSEVKNGMQIYGATKQDVRAAVNSLKRKKMHVIYTALHGENDTQIYPDMSSGSRKILLADLEYVFYAKPSRKFRTQPENVAYIVKDNKGKEVARNRTLMTKCKIPKAYWGKVPPLVSQEEGMDLAEIWRKITSARGAK